MNDSDEANSLRRGIRIDLVIAICALVVSAFATGAALWESHIVARQLGAQVWPYVTFGANYDDNAVTLSIENDGLGPAVMRSVVASVDGKPRSTYVALLRALIADSPAANDKQRSVHVGLNMSAPGEGSVLRPGETVKLLKLQGGKLPREIGQAVLRVQFAACYCSIEGECWNADSSAADPAPLPACPRVTGNLLARGAITPVSGI